MFVYFLRINNFYFLLLWFFFFFILSTRNSQCSYPTSTYLSRKKKMIHFFFFFDYFLKYFFLLKLSLKRFFFKLFFFKFIFFFNFLIDRIFIFFKYSNIISSLNLKNFFLNFLNFTFLCIVKHDPEFFLNGIKMDLQEISFKNHKNYFLLLRVLFFYFYKYVNVYYGVFGIYFEVVGKISLGGNSKTKFLKFFFGKTSFLNKKYLLSIFKTHIFTYSGALGLLFIIFF